MLALPILVIFYRLLLLPEREIQAVATRTIQAQQPILKVAALITRLDTTTCYVVIKATILADQHKVIILASRDEKDGVVVSAKSGAVVTLGKTYTFMLQATGILQIAPSQPPLLLNLRPLSIGNLHLLDGGELPYKALNMNGYTIYQ